jgi:nucleoside-diphosphate-sugar epimerase
LVTGGCSFIGSHLVDELVERGAAVRIVDNLSSGVLANVQHHLGHATVDLRVADLLAPGVADAAVAGMDHVFHLAATHGGRGYIDLHQAACATNLALDGIMVQAAHRGGVQKFTFASSGCVYPEHLQQHPDEVLYLTEDLVVPPYAADNMYGWAKLMCELTLRAYHEDYGFKCASLRYFTAYGERCLENHAVIAMIARAFVKQDPFIVWGTGEQIRNWTYVGDIVEGTILAAERVDNATAINLGTMERTRVIDAARMILERTNGRATLLPDPTKPTGPYNRVCDNELARRLLEWTPKVSFSDGLSRTIAWYYSTKQQAEIARDLERLLTER